MPSLLQLVHGFPPREAAGTEQYAARLADALRARGWRVHTLAATRLPGARMYSRIEEPGVTRIVQNAPYSGVRRAERDAVMRAAIEAAARDVDLVHLQHPMFLDTDFSVRAPVVWTLHDAWAWCAAGGTLLREGAACAGPGPACAPCASAWVKDSPRLEVALGAAGMAGRLVRPERLHGAWQRLPARVRAWVGGRGGTVSAAQIERRLEATRGLAARCTLVAPSRWLAAEAERQGLGPVRVLPHGVDGALGERPRAGFVFLGTIAPHKGPALVAEAWRRSGSPVPLRIIGPDGPDAAYVARVPHEPAVTDVGAILRGAQALVLGAIWPENAPLIVLEARAAGCPVIAPRIGGLPELVEEGVDGWLYPPGDVDALAALLRSFDAGSLRVRPPPTFGAHVDALLAVYAGLLAR